MSAEDTKPEGNTPSISAKTKTAIGVGCAALLLMALFLGFRALAGVSTTSSKQETEVNVVAVLDTPLLTMLQLKSVQDSLSDVDEASRSAADFAGRMTDILEEYREAGILVINKSAALSVPAMNDITPLVAKRLGIDLDQPNAYD